MSKRTAITQRSLDNLDMSLAVPIMLAFLAFWRGWKSDNNIGPGKGDRGTYIIILEGSCGQILSGNKLFHNRIFDIKPFKCYTHFKCLLDSVI